MAEIDQAFTQTLEIMEPGEFLSVVPGSVSLRHGETGELKLNLNRIFEPLFPWNLDRTAHPPRDNPAGELGCVAVKAERIGDWDYDMGEDPVYHVHRMLRVGDQILSVAACNVSYGNGRAGTMVFVGKPEK